MNTQNSKFEPGQQRAPPGQQAATDPSKSNVKFKQPLPPPSQRQSPTRQQEGINSVSQITNQKSSQFSLKGNGNRKLLNNFTSEQEESNLLQSSEAQLELAIQQEQERAEQYAKHRKEHIDSRRLAAKSLMFGTEPILSYRGHNGQPVLSIIENQNNRLNVSSDQKTIHFWSSKPTHGNPQAQVVKMIDIVKSHSSVITMTYSKKYRLYLIVTSDFKFIFMNELNIVVEPHIEMSQIRLVNHVHFHDEKDLLITGGNHGVFIFKFDYKGKYSPHLAAQVDPKGAYIELQLLQKQPVANMLEWCKGLRIDTRSNIIISWDWEIVSINTLAHHGRLVSQFKDNCDKDEKILDVLVFSDYRYFVTATSAGNIYVFKYVTMGKVETQRRLIHTFNGHFKAIPSICQFEKQPQLLLSASYDCTARIWSLDTFQHQYTFELPSGLNFIKIFQGARYITCGKADNVQTHELHLVLENYTPTESSVTSLSTAYNTIWDRLDSKPMFTISLCDDNSAFLKQVDSTTKDQKTTLYPPPSSQVMQSISYSTRLDRLIVLLTNSTLCIYKRLKETALLEWILEPREILDSEGKRAINQDVTYMSIFQTRLKRDIRCMDTDVINHKMHVLSLLTSLACPYKNQEFIAIGLSKGAIILIHTRQLQQVYVRLTLHREAITMIRYLPNARMFVTFCCENYFKIWRCHNYNRKAQVCFDFKLTKKTQEVLVMYNAEDTMCERFLVIFTSGESELFEFDSTDDSLYWIESEKAREHDSQLTGYDYSPKLRLIVTGDITGVIRIWTAEKRFLREINFPTPIDSVCFLNDRGDLLVSHAKRVSSIKFTTYWSKVFDYYGVTVAKEDTELAQKAKDDESLFCDPDFVVEQWDTSKRIKIDSNEKFRMVFQGKPQNSQKSLLTTASDISQATNLPEKNLAIEKRNKSVSKVIAANNLMKSSRTQKPTQKKNQTPTIQTIVRAQPTTSDSVQQSTINAFQSKITFVSQEPTEEQIQQKKNSWSYLQDADLTHDDRKNFLARKLKQVNPFNVTALPRPQGLPKVGLIQPLPGMSYLATSTTYYEMQAQKRHKSNKSALCKSTRRNITENRITSNIMSYNTPHALTDNQHMEVSSDYQTSVSQSKYQLSGYRLGSLFSQQPLPLDYLLNTDLTYLSNQLMTQRMNKQQQNENQSNLFGSFHSNGGGNIESQKQSRNRKMRTQHRTRKGSQEIECQTPWSGAIHPSSTTAVDHPLNTSSMNVTSHAEQRRRTVIPPSVRAQFSLEFQQEGNAKANEVDTITNRKTTTAPPMLKDTLKEVGTLKIQNGSMLLPPQSQLLPSTTADFDLNNQAQSEHMTTHNSVAKNQESGTPVGQDSEQKVTELDLKVQVSASVKPVTDEVLIGGSAINTAAVDDYADKPFTEHPQGIRQISSKHASNKNLTGKAPAISHSNSVIQPNLSNTLIGSSKQNRSGTLGRNSSSRQSKTHQNSQKSSGRSHTQVLDTRNSIPTQQTQQILKSSCNNSQGSYERQDNMQINGTSLTPQLPPIQVDVGNEVKQERREETEKEVLKVPGAQSVEDEQSIEMPTAFKERQD